MIQRHRPGAARRRSGFIALALLMAGTALIAQAATRHGEQAPALSQAMNTVTQSSPIYPADAIKNKEQGTVVLLVLVGPDGKPIKAEAEPATKAAPDLIKAATDTVMTWRFEPKRENGKPIEAYARVPISFRLTPPPPPAPPPPPSAAIPPPPPPPPAPPAPNSSNF